MPFDGNPEQEPIVIAPTPPKPAVLVIDGAINLIADRRNWCKDVMLTPFGQRCMVGAVESAAILLPPEQRKQAMIGAIKALKMAAMCALPPAAQDEIGCAAHPAQVVMYFNDRPGTTHPMVMNVMRVAREYAAVT